MEQREKMKKEIKDHDSDFELEKDIREREKLYHKWSEFENKVYGQYLMANRQEFQITKERRSLNFFTRMSKQLAIGKTNLQCRSHHQKMLKRHGSVEKIIDHFLGDSFLDLHESPPGDCKSATDHRCPLKLSSNSAWHFYVPL